MAADLSALKTKIGPLPGYAWAGVAAGAIALVVLARRNTGSKAPTSTQPRAGTVPGTVGSSGPDYSLGYSQGLAAAGTSAANPAVSPAGGTPTAPSTSPPAGSSGTVAVVTTIDSGSRYSAPNTHNVPLYGPSKDSSGITAWVPPGTTLRVAGAITPYGIPAWYVGTQVLVPPDLAQLNYVDASSAPPGSSGGIGGGKPSIGSRSSRLMHYAHPDVKRAPKFSHFAAGPPAVAHERGLATAAERAGVHPARLAILNRPGSGYLRVA